MSLNVRDDDLIQQPPRFLAPELRIPQTLALSHTRPAGDPGFARVSRDVHARVPCLTPPERCRLRPVEAVLEALKDGIHYDLSGPEQLVMHWDQ